MFDRPNLIIGAAILITGVLFYLFFRENLPFGWYAEDPTVWLHGTPLGRVFLSSYPDISWVLSFLFFSEEIKFKNPSLKGVAQWSLPALGIIQELLQKIQVLPGTFDTLDTLAYLVTPVLYQLYHKIKS